MHRNMNGAAVGNTVRPPGAPFARPRAALGRKISVNRQSNALRASVFDVAMQIGLGANGAVTDWVYNNSVSEEEVRNVFQLLPRIWSVAVLSVGGDLTLHLDC